MLQIGLEPFKKTASKPFLQTGFRPFFLLASAYAVFTMILWGGIYLFQWSIPFVHSDGSLWHAHEMIYGYTLAVIAGFLLTAVRNWTRQQTADGPLLLALIIFWAIGRIPPITTPLAYFQAFGDITFGFLLVLVIATPILRRKLTKQWPVWIILSFLLLFNILYYLSTFRLIAMMPQQVIYLSLFLVLNLIFIFTRRLIPNFINSALRPKKPIKNRLIIDKVLIPLFLAFSFNEVFLKQQELAFGLSIILLIFNLLRLYDWYHKGIWSRHLIWSLYASYSFLTFVFLLKALEYVDLFSALLTTHMFTVGGIGLITLAMMTRVSFGHTGRNIMEEIQATRWIFYSLLASVLFRVILPFFFMSRYVQLVGIAMFFWILTFLIFFFQFLNVLTQKRVDGLYG